MNHATLDSILGASSARGSGAGAVLSSASRLSEVNGAVLADIQRMDVQSGQVVHELLRLDRGGRRRASVVLDVAPQETERAVAAALLGPDGPGLMQVGGSAVLALSDSKAALARAIAALTLDRVDHLLLRADGAVVCGVDQGGQTAVWAMTDAGDAQTLPLAELRLSEARPLSALTCLDSTLFAAVADPVTGFEVYRCDMGDPAAGFTQIIARGAQRFSLNAAVASMLPHPKGVLLGTAALAAPKRAVGHWGPELLLLSEDGSWDMIIGQPRFSPSGLILPASGMLPGMGRPRNAAIRAMDTDGTLTVIAVQDHAGPTLEDRRHARLDLSEYGGAARLFASFDLEEWTEVPHDMPSDIGSITCLHVTEEALYVGHEAPGADANPVQVVPLAG